MKIGWYVTNKGEALRPWMLERTVYIAGGRAVGHTVLLGGDSKPKRWKTREGAQGHADKLNREEALS